MLFACSSKNHLSAFMYTFPDFMYTCLHLCALQWLKGTGAAERTSKLKNALWQLHAHVAPMLENTTLGASFKFEDFVKR